MATESKTFGGQAVTLDIAQGSDLGGNVHVRKFLGLGSYLIAIVWVTFRSGVESAVSLEDMVSASILWPSRSQDWVTGVYADSPLPLLLGKLLGLTTNLGFIRLSLLTSMLALALLSAWVAQQVDGNDKWFVARLAVLLPISAVIFHSLGGYDSYTLLCWAAALFAWSSGKNWLLFTTGALVGFQHFEQALFGVTALYCACCALRSDLPNRLKPSKLLRLFPGVFAGKILLIAIFLATNQPVGARTDWITNYLVTWSKNGFATMPLLLWSLFAGAWAMVLVIWFQHPVRSTRSWLVLALIVGLIATFITGDRPRVFELVCTPALLVGIVAFARHETTNLRTKRAVEVLMWLAPPVLLFSKEVANSNIYDSAYVLVSQVLALS